MSLATRKIMPRNEPEQVRRSTAGGTSSSGGDAVRFRGADRREGSGGAAAGGHRPRRRRSSSCSEDYANRGVNLVRIDGKWTFRTATDLSWLLSKETTERRKLSRAAIETLAIIAYHQPVTRSEIEELRGVSTSAGSVDVLLETGWIRPRGRRKTPGRPVTYGTTAEFLSHFGLDAGRRSAGPGGAQGRRHVRRPAAGRLLGADAVRRCRRLRDDEDPLEPGDLDLGLAPPPERSSTD